jgi:hypothetical protein
MAIGSWADWVMAGANLGIAGAAVCGAILGYRGLNAWRTETIGKRKAELAEQVLADFYEARDVFQSARQPFAFDSEGSTRKKEDGETEQDTQKLNTYFTISERLLKKTDLFATLHARQYRFLALFGHNPNQIKPYDELFKVRNEIMLAVTMLMMSSRQSRIGEPPADGKLREKWQTAIGWGNPKDDDIANRLDQIVETIERICRPAIEVVEKKAKI